MRIGPEDAGLEQSSHQLLSVGLERGPQTVSPQEDKRQILPRLIASMKGTH